MNSSRNTSARLEKQLSNAAPLFAALGDETRLLLLARLTAGKAMSVSRLVDGTRMSRQAVSKHLNVLHSAGLAHCTRHGREQLWQLEPVALREAERYLGLLSRQWDAALDRLAAALGETGQS